MKTKFSMKTLAPLAGASLIALAGASAIAQTTSPVPDRQSQAQPQPQAQAQAQTQTRRSDAEALLNARLAGIRAGLNLTPEQESLFAPVEQAYRLMVTERRRRFEERRGERRPGDRERLDLMEHLDRRAERATESAQRITGLAAAMRPFWASLDEDQKRLLPRLMRMGGGDRHMGMMRHHRDHHMGRGGRMEHGGRMERDRSSRDGGMQRL